MAESWVGIAAFSTVQYRTATKQFFLLDIEEKMWKLNLKNSKNPSLCSEVVAESIKLTVDDGTFHLCMRKGAKHFHYHLLMRFPPLADLTVISTMLCVECLRGFFENSQFKCVAGGWDGLGAEVNCDFVIYWFSMADVAEDVNMGEMLRCYVYSWLDVNTQQKSNKVKFFHQICKINMLLYETRCCSLEQRVKI